MQVLRRLPDNKNISINLTVSLGRGGEACVYAVPTDSSSVAKIYHKPTEEHGHKLEVMIAHPPDNPTASLGHISIAWPTEALYSSHGNDRIVGFLMPRLRGMRPIIDFYNPRTRRQHCPLFNYQYLLRTARNMAAAFASLHASGYCIGDVNESNILVSDAALVTVVDTDSFQVSDPNHKTVYRCKVGKPEFTPPELQNKNFSQHERSETHDLFGLGVLIFQLLMEGTHPFSGIYQGTGEPPAYEVRIAEGHFTYSQGRKVPYVATPIAPNWEILHPTLQQLFVRCFEDGHYDPKLRPSAQHWLLALAEAEEALVTCSSNPQHIHSNHLHKCPWCERTSRLGGRDPFPSPEAIAAKEHLKPRIKSKRPSSQPQRLPQNTIPWKATNFPQRGSAQNVPYYQPIKKRRLYPMMFCLVGFGLLGYLDWMIKLTNRPFISQSAYTQQVLKQTQAAANNYTFDDYYKQGHALYKIRNYQEAVEKFSKAIEKKSEHSKAYVNRGNAHYNLKEYQAALADYNKAIEINPSEIKAYVNRGNVHHMLAEYSTDPDEEYKLAIADYDRALNINRKDAEAFIRRGIVRSQIAKYSGDSQNDFKKAINDFNYAININPKRAEAYYQRGLLRYQIAQYSSSFESEYKQAINDFSKALQINSRLAKVYLKRGVVRYELAQYGLAKTGKNHKKAVDDLQKAAKISLEQEDMDNYQQALSSICVVLENRCDTFFQNSNVLGKSS
ncbi:MAG: tetratricopeptide repeat protein [Mastigocoleus sp. MO_167.B18]|nr:tetratricopeptide repeat protein [Mastigocoleus sp. MO_167.B18]